MKDTEKIDEFLERILSTRKESDLVECLKAWEVGSSEWNEGAMMLFEEELLYPLSQVVEYLRRGRQIDSYIDHIALLKAPDMVTKEAIFHSLKSLREENEGAVQRVLCRIYEENDMWDTIDSSIRRDDIGAFEASMGSDERSINLKKIVCHYRSIIESSIPLYRRYDHPYLVEDGGEKPITSSVEEQKLVAKEILSLCAKLMLNAQEESYIKQICKNPTIEEALSFEALRYYYRVREKKATTITEKAEAEATPIEPQPSPEYYTKEEVLRLLDVSNTTLYNWNIDGTLRHHKIGRKVYYLRADIDEALKLKR